MVLQVSLILLIRHTTVTVVVSHLTLMVCKILTTLSQYLALAFVKVIVLMTILGLVGVALGHLLLELGEGLCLLLAFVLGWQFVLEVSHRLKLVNVNASVQSPRRVLTGSDHLTSVALQLSLTVLV